MTEFCGALSDAVESIAKMVTFAARGVVKLNQGRGDLKLVSSVCGVQARVGSLAQRYSAARAADLKCEPVVSLFVPSS